MTINVVFAIKIDKKLDNLNYLIEKSGKKQRKTVEIWHFPAAKCTRGGAGTRNELRFLGRGHVSIYCEDVRNGAAFEK